MPNANNDLVLTAAEKLRLRLQAAQSKSLPDYATTLWALQGKR